MQFNQGQIQTLSQNEQNLLTTNLMQIELADNFGITIDEFIEKYASSFREIINADQSLITKYNDNPETVITFLKSKLYH